jgi:YbbR domain-containing protein
MPKGLMFQRNPPRELRVEIVGPLSRIRSISDESLAYGVDLSSIKPGPNRVEIDSELLKLPTELEITNISPRSFNVHIEELFVRALPVKLNIIGKPKEGYQVVSTKTMPENVSVTGPKSVITKLKEVTLDIPVSGRETSYFETIKPRLNLPDSDVLDSVSVELEVSSIRSTREFLGVPVVARESAGKLSISPPVAKVVLEGMEKDLDNLKGKLQVFISVEGLKRGRYRLRGSLPTSDGTKLILVEPSHFLVEVR